MSFKQLCSPVTAIPDPWNCVVYRDISLLKARLVSFPDLGVLGWSGNETKARSCNRQLLRGRSDSQTFYGVWLSVITLRVLEIPGPTAVEDEPTRH